jgi:hypothetical protein
MLLAAIGNDEDGAVKIRGNDPSDLSLCFGAAR